MTKLVFKQIKGQGPNLVLLHGWATTSEIFVSLVPELARHFRVFLLDLPGYGSNKACMPANYDLPSVSDMLAQVLPTDCILAGWSLGGLIAQQIANRQHPHLLKLVLMASTPKFVQVPDSWPGVSSSVFESFKQQLTLDAGKAIERFAAIQAMGSQTIKQDIKHARRAISSVDLPDSTALSGGLEILSTTDLRAQLVKTRIPTMRIYGRQDSLVPAAGAHLIRTYHTASGSLVVANAAHMPFISHPSQIAEALIAFCLT